MRRSTIIHLALSIWLALPCLVSAQPTEIYTGLQRVAKNISREFVRKYPDSWRESLVVLEFNSSLELAERQVGFAVSELLSGHFEDTHVFLIVPRAELTLVLQEEKLLHTGAIDADTAVKVGRRLSAKLLVTGAVTLSGGRYRIDARLINVESNTILAAAGVDLPSAEFDEDARSHTVRLGDAPAFGVYLLHNIRQDLRGEGSNTADLGGVPATVFPRAHLLHGIGAGFRWFPHHWLLADTSLTLTLPVRYARTETNTGLTQVDDRIASSLISRLTLSIVQTWKEDWRLFAGVGGAVYSLRSAAGGKVLDQVVPSLRLGFDYRPKPRWTVGMSVHGDLITHKGKAHGVDALRVNQFSVEPTLGVSF